MPNPVTSRDPLYTPSAPENDVCTTEGALVCSTENAAHEPPPEPRATSPSSNPASHHDEKGFDYFTVSGGASAIIGGDVSLTLDRYGHLYVGVGGGVGVSATVASASIHGGQLTDSTRGAPSAEQLKGFLAGDSVQVSGGFGPEIGVTSAPSGAAVETGVGVPQAGAQFQHSWYVLDLPVEW